MLHGWNHSGLSGKPVSCRSNGGTSAGWTAIDAMIDNLSISGCRLTIPASASIDEDVMIGLAGVGIRSARVVWSGAGHMGCAFDKPLTMAEFQQAQFVQTVAEGRFPSHPRYRCTVRRIRPTHPNFIRLRGSSSLADWRPPHGLWSAGRDRELCTDRPLTRRDTPRHSCRTIATGLATLT